MSIKFVYNPFVTVLLCSIMSGNRINYYIVKEVLGPTLLCLMIFTMVLLMGRLMKLVDMVVNKGVSIGDIAILFGTMLPTFLNITLPLAFLMGIMIGLSRMSADNETVALKAAGIGLAQISRPVFFLALLFSILTGVADLALKPWGYQAFREQVFAITMQKATIGFQPQVFMKQFDNLVLYANEIDNRSGELNGLFIVEDKPEATMLIFADQGNIVASEQEETITFRLRDGSIHRQEKSSDTAYQLINFQNYDVQPNLNNDDSANLVQGPRRKKPKEMDTADLWKEIGLAESSEYHNKLSALQAELHSRLVAPLAPLLFALFGLPFSIQSNRSGRSGGFVIGLTIYLCYYLMLSLAKTFTADANLSPLATFWAPHALLGMIGIYCLKQNAKEQPNRLISWLEQTFVAIGSRLKRIDEHS